MEKRGPLGFKLGPLRRWLAERETWIRRPKFFKDPPEEIAIDRKVPVEEVIEITAKLPWARGWAEGIAKMAGYTPGTPEYNAQVDRLSRFAAKRLVEGA